MSRKTKTEELTKMSRRRFAEALGGMGLSAGVVNFMTQDVLAEQTEDPRDEVPRLYGRQVKNPEVWKDKRRTKDNRPDMQEMWYTIPRSQWVRVETAQDACQKLQAQMDELEPSGLLQVGVKSEYNRKKSEKRLVVHYTTHEYENGKGEIETQTPNVSFERVEEEAPYSVTGTVGEGKNKEEVDVEVTVTRSTTTSDYCSYNGDFYDYYYEDCPAGAQTDAPCTTGSPGYHPDYGYVCTTSGHCYDLHDYVYQPDTSDSNNYLGQVEEREFWREGDPDRSDMSVIQTAAGRTAHYWIASDSGSNQYDEYIAGTLSWSTITDMEDSLQQMEKQGATTGRCAGDVEETYGGRSVRTFEVNAARQGGDSGGPHFNITDGYAYIAGNHRGEGPTGYAEGVYWKDQYDRFNMSFQ